MWTMLWKACWLVSQFRDTLHRLHTHTHTRHYRSRFGYRTAYGPKPGYTELSHMHNSLQGTAASKTRHTQTCSPASSTQTLSYIHPYPLAAYLQVRTRSFTMQRACETTGQLRLSANTPHSSECFQWLAVALDTSPCLKMRNRFSNGSNCKIAHTCMKPLTGHRASKHAHRVRCGIDVHLRTCAAKREGQGRCSVYAL